MLSATDTLGSFSILGEFLFACYTVTLSTEAQRDVDLPQSSGQIIKCIQLF